MFKRRRMGVINVTAEVSKVREPRKTSEEGQAADFYTWQQNAGSYGS